MGRPPASDSAETRRRILETARDLFATGGFAGTTNRDIAARAGVTSAALYHYFSSKLEIYLAVLDDISDLVHQWLTESTRGHGSFRSAFGHVLDEAMRLASVHPSIPGFLGSVRVDSRREPGIAVMLEARRADVAAVFAELVDLGVSTGEIPAHRRAEMSVFVFTVLFGLTEVLAGESDAQALAVDSFKAAVAGRLVEQPHH